MVPIAIGTGSSPPVGYQAEERKRKAAHAAFFDSPLLLEQRERKEGCPDERQQSMDGVV